MKILLFGLLLLSSYCFADSAVYIVNNDLLGSVSLDYQVCDMTIKCFSSGSTPFIPANSLYTLVVPYNISPQLRVFPQRAVIMKNGQKIVMNFKTINGWGPCWSEGQDAIVMRSTSDDNTVTCTNEAIATTEDSEK